MSDTTAIGVADGVAACVREVRAELADLPAEDVGDRCLRRSPAFVSGMQR